jgi:hypothetical protein
MRLKPRQNALIALAAIAASTSFAKTAMAQRSLSDFHPSFYGSTELDTRHSDFYLLGVYVGVGGLGWSPYFNVNGYYLDYIFSPALPKADSTMSAVLPTLGLAYAGRRSGVSFGGGYAFVSHEDPGAPGAEGGGATGATASLGAYYSGTGRRPLHTQLLSNYNFGSQYAWARGRASVPFGRSNKHPARIGAEVVGQGGGKGGRKSNTFQAGPTVEYEWTPAFRTTGAIGYKSVGGPIYASRESATYFKLEFSFSP